MAGRTPATTEYDSPIRVLHGDCLEVMRGLADASVHAVVTDPPYGLSAEPDMVEVLTAWLAGDRYEHHANGFMGKAWDAFLPGPEYWREVYRLLLPGGHLLCFAGTRTWDVMSVAIRLAGFQNRDTIASQFGPVSALQWCQGSGFPKSLDVSKAIDRQRDDWPDIAAVVRWLEAQRKRSGVTRKAVERHFGTQNVGQGFFTLTPGSKPRTPTWEQWQQLRALLGFSDEMDAEVWRLNGRKGKPGEAWYERDVIGRGECGDPAAWYAGGQSSKLTYNITAPATDAAKQWSGWGSALKPAWEPVLVFRKPLAESSIAAQVLATGTGAINIGQSRVGEHSYTQEQWNSKGLARTTGNSYGVHKPSETSLPAGRYPPNLLFTHALACTPDACADECPVAILDAQSGVSVSSGGDGSALKHGFLGAIPRYVKEGPYGLGYGDTGGASRFFPQFAPDAEATPEGDPLATLAAPFLYTSKASRRERNAGCEALPLGEPPASARSNPAPGRQAALGAPRTNHHPCVKPQSLMRWLATLICPPGGVILDPFAGSGSTGVAAAQLGYRAILIEREAEYLPIIQARVAWGLAHPLTTPTTPTHPTEPPQVVTPTPTRPKRTAKRAKIAILATHDQPSLWANTA